ncbi:MAG TPA: fasciclin domain-containing protein [Allocoleopsis sp.]
MKVKHQLISMLGVVSLGMTMALPLNAETKIAHHTPSHTATISKKPIKGKTIVDLASSNKNFKTLVKALKAAGLVETLSGKGPFTVFAPTDAAFAKLPKGTLEDLLKPENKEKLVKILTYHVVPGNIKANQIKPGEVTTVAGSPIKLQLHKGKVMVNDAHVILPNVVGSNGVIHVIDKVILPPQ